MLTLLALVLASAPETTGAYLVKDVWAGPQTSNLFCLTDVNGVLFFVADDGIHRNPSWYPGAARTLWRSDGTAAGTFMVAPVVADRLTRVGDRVFFRDYDGSLYVSDGTAGGTALLARYPGIGKAPEGLMSAGGDLALFTADDGAGLGLWRSDGTASGTFRLTTEPPLGAASATYAAAVVGRRLFFAMPGPDRTALWKTDGSLAGTAAFAQVPHVVAGTGNFVGIGDRLYFDVRDEVSGTEPWVSDGTESGTHRLRDVRPGPEGSSSYGFTRALGATFFVANGSRPMELWRTDGTGGGTRKVADNLAVYEPISGFLLGPQHFTASGRLLFYTVTDDLFDGRQGEEVWRSDGTAKGTHLLKDICPGGCSSNPRSLVDAKGVLFFAADDGVHGVQLWSSDGTREGTRMRAEIDGGIAGSAPYSLTLSGDRLYFTAMRTDIGRELWALPLSRR
jgi:ELWxxDGT repeat protein